MLVTVKEGRLFITLIEYRGYPREIHLTFDEWEELKAKVKDVLKKENEANKHIEGIGYTQ